MAALINPSNLILEPLTPETAPTRATEFLATIPPYPGDFAGRGVVICAGGVRYLTCAWVLINMLRRLGCKLPIEVWYLGEAERDADWMALVEPLGVRCVDAREVSRQLGVNLDSREEKTRGPREQAGRIKNADEGSEFYTPHPRLNGWESKAFAILHCPFEEVLFLDADNVPAADPTFLFDTPEYQAYGAIFWPDWCHMARERPAWRIFDVAFRDESEQESGQIVVDKRRCWPAICLADWYNRHSDFYYSYVYGDKDTFRFAWYRTGIAYAMPARIGQFPNTICQGDFDGRLLFQHRVGDKWSLRGNRRIPGFQREAACAALIRELSAVWRPRTEATSKQADNIASGSRLTKREHPSVRTIARREPASESGRGAISNETGRSCASKHCNQPQTHFQQVGGLTP